MNFNIYDYNFTIKLLSGIHIGAGDTEMRIGGVDNKALRNPVDDMPYIPGSSLKGKVRSLLEYCAGIQKLRNDGQPFTGKDMNKGEEIAAVVKLFGAGGSDKGDSGVTRLSFADAFLSDDDKNCDKNLFEVKAETAIDRKTGTALRGSLRFAERVIAGLKFNGRITMKIFADDDKEAFEKILLKGLKLLTMDALGGYGSRGYGRVELKFDDDKVQKEFDSIEL